MKVPAAAVLLMLALSLACARGEFPAVPAPQAMIVSRPIPHSLTAAPLDTATLNAWERTGLEALAVTLPLKLPFQEVFYLGGEPAAALAYALELEAGQIFDVELLPEGDAPPPVLDILEYTAAAEYWPAATARGGASAFAFEAPRTGAYVLRVRPAPRNSGRYRLALSSPQRLHFPVAGGDVRAVRGRFGDARDGGSRDHAGVDIFAPRGTPVLASADAVVSEVETTRTGGRIIWAVDERRKVSYLYAHLDRQLVRAGARVTAGDTIGTVGNTGNARSSSPHLHFGVYLPSMAAVDPLPLLAPDEAAGPPVVSDSAVAGLGGWARTRAHAALLRASPDRDSPVLSELGEGTVVRLLGAVQEWRRVQVPDGAAGFIASWLLEPFVGSH